jgi:glycosyltransferase involved in cell wall biosynthesis
MTDKLPLVSILIPTHNRPEYFEIALRSALAQDYPNLEIIVSDNSDDNDTQTLVAEYQERYQAIMYLRTRNTDATTNFKNALSLSSGTYISFLMDDDVFHPEKISRMMQQFLQNPSVGLVTSFRKLIDKNGVELGTILGTEKLFETDTFIEGKSLARFMLDRGNNIIGEPTTPIVLKEDLPDGFGWFCDRRYKLLSDVATWLSILSKKDCVYISDALSYFRLHDGQDQKSDYSIRYRASLEWLNLTLDAIANNLFNGQVNEHISTLSYKYSNLKQIIESDLALSDVSEELLEGLDRFASRMKLFESQGSATT